MSKLSNKKEIPQKYYTTKKNKNKNRITEISLNK